jgi:hypothetical protein
VDAYRPSRYAGEDLRQHIRVTVHGYMRGRLEALGKSLSALQVSTDIVRERVLDSLALTGLIAAVEHATGREIDFLDVDPDALGTIDEIVDELTRVLEGGAGR